MTDSTRASGQEAPLVMSMRRGAALGWAGVDEAAGAEPAAGMVCDGAGVGVDAVWDIAGVPVEAAVSQPVDRSSCFL